MKVILDTHVVLWWLDGNKNLSIEASQVISDCNTMVFVSAASAWEISIKKALGKLQAPDNLEEALQMNRFQPLAITVSHALLAGQLPPYHDDPFDRLLVAQAKIEELILITRDAKQLLYEVQTIVA